MNLTSNCLFFVLQWIVDDKKTGHLEQIDLALFRKRDSKVSRRESLQNVVYIPIGYIRSSRLSY